MRLLSALMCSLLVAPAALMAAESGASPLDPVPKVAPLVPSITNDAALSPSERLQRQLEALARERDVKIRALLEERGDLRPASDTLQHNTLAEPFRERNQAREDLRRALESYDERRSSRPKDVLESNRPVEQAMQRATLAATNQLRIAECYYDLSIQSQPAPADLLDGMAALELVTVQELETGDIVRYRYLRAWYLIERTLLATGTERSELYAQAKTAVERLIQDHPSSELATTARNLFARLTPTGSAP